MIFNLFGFGPFEYGPLGPYRANNVEDVDFEDISEQVENNKLIDETPEIIEFTDEDALLSD